nr:non-LTR retroelement reverse transcriptase-like [Ipomoea batatas]
MANFNEVQVRHVYREQNRLADALAKRASRAPAHYTEFLEVPCDLARIIEEDLIGKQFVRHVPVNGMSTVL